VQENERRRGRRRRPRRSSNRRREPAPPPLAVGSDVRRGTIKWFNRGRSYGFIQAEDGSEVFFHESAVVLGASDGSLTKGRAVEFEIRGTPKGQQAVNVVLSGNGAEPESESVSLASSAAAKAPSPAPRSEPVGPTLDFSKRLPNSWKRKPVAFVYTYTLISGRRHG